MATARRYIHKAVDLLAAAAPTLDQAMRRIRDLAFVILDATLTAIDRLHAAKDRPTTPANISAMASTSRSSPTPTAA
jgi:hypothetical protein